jgi:hypothetical protein
VRADVTSAHAVVLDIDAPPLFTDVLELAPTRSGGERPVRLFSELLNTAAGNWR